MITREQIVAAMIAYDTVLARTSTPNIREKYDAIEAALLAAQHAVKRPKVPA